MKTTVCRDALRKQNKVDVLHGEISSYARILLVSCGMKDACRTACYVGAAWDALCLNTSYRGSMVLIE